MIKIYTGAPGSGKTYHAVQDIWYWIKAKRHVITNIMIDFTAKHWTKLDKSYYHYITTEKLKPGVIYDIIIKAYPDTQWEEGDIKICIDECQCIWNSRKWQDESRMSWIELFTLSRHLGMDITLIAQDLQMIDSQMRSLVSIEEHFINLKYVKYLRTLLCMFPITVYLARETMLAMKVQNSVMFGVVRSKYAKAYDTKQIVCLEEFKKMIKK